MINNIIFAFVAALVLLGGALVYLVYRVHTVSCKANELYSIGMNKVMEIDKRLEKEVNMRAWQINTLRDKLKAVTTALEAEKRMRIHDAAIQIKSVNEQIKEIDERTKNALERTENAQNSIKNELDELNSVFNDLVQGYLAAETEAANAEARAEEAFNKGINNIINYGDSVARLNKEGINGRQ